MICLRDGVLVGTQIFNNDIVTFDIQFVNDVRSGIFFVEERVVHPEPAQIISNVSIELRVAYHHPHDIRFTISGPPLCNSTLPVNM